MRSGPGTNHEILWSAGKYYPVDTLEKSGSWYKIRDFEGDEAWIHGSLLKKIPAVIVKAPLVNVREKPGTDFRILFQAEKGVSFKRLGKRATGSRSSMQTARWAGCISPWSGDIDAPQTKNCPKSLSPCNAPALQRAVSQTRTPLSGSLKRFFHKSWRIPLQAGLKQALDLSKNVSEQAERNLGNSPLTGNTGSSG